MRNLYSTRERIKMRILKPPFLEQSKSATAIIYLLKAYTYPYDMDTYPFAIDITKLGFYSSLEKAGEVMRMCIQDEHDKLDGCSIIHSFSIRMIEFDSLKSDTFLGEYVYDENLQCCGNIAPFDDPFHGKDSAENRYRPGDIVEFILHGHQLQLQVGIILNQPPTREWVQEAQERVKRRIFDLVPEDQGRCKPNDFSFIDQSDNTYFVALQGNLSDHEHLSQCDLFPPRFAIPVATRDALLEKYHFFKAGKEPFF